ncbi:MAG: molybdenum cofactor guanylyltransferase [Phycisphaeraceae bacterium]|nr:molybdenum cofactor guanylyltransferase [Phycisphaeraceae bacterium]
MNNSAITGVILAGGKNSRMGSDKGMLEVEGKKIVERIIEVIKPFIQEVIIISNGTNYDNLGYAVYKDIIKDAGPMGGIHTALQYSKTDKILVISCDMPFVSKEVILPLITWANSAEVVLPEHGDGHTEPLCAVYSKSCFSKFAELLRSGEWKMRNAMKYFDVRKILFPENESTRLSFLNINTPVEYQSVKQKKHEYSN